MHMYMYAMYSVYIVYDLINMLALNNILERKGSCMQDKMQIDLQFHSHCTVSVQLRLEITILFYR